MLSGSFEDRRETVLSVSLPLPRQRVELGARRSREEILRDAFHNTRTNYTPRLEPEYYKDNQGYVCACVCACEHVCGCMLMCVLVIMYA